MSLSIPLSLPSPLRGRFTVSACVISILVLVLYYSPRSATQSPRVQHLSHVATIKTPPARQRFAFATFLNGPDTELDDDDEDKYYVAARMLAYQFLHDPTTRSTKYPFHIFVTENVKPHKRRRLARDGALVVELEGIYPAWFNVTTERWQHQFTKLRLFQQTQYDRIAYFDTDTLLLENMDDIFEDAAVRDIKYNLNISDRASPDEGLEPASYVLAATIEQYDENHTFPSTDGDYFNAGCVVLHPSNEMFEHYSRVFDIPDRFDPFFMEQDLYNYVHRREGNMPWSTLSPGWNVNFPNLEDFSYGVRSLHAKWWWSSFPEMESEFSRVRGRMEGFYSVTDDLGWSFE